jgi:hypothetical protein
MGLLTYNTTDPLGLSINIQGTAADAWKSYMDGYQVALEVALANAEQDLRNVTYNDGQDFVEFIFKLRTKWANATALGAKIDDLSFRMIILNALPRSWDSIVATLYNTHSSREAINHLMTHWARVSRDRVVDPRHATAALRVSSGNPSGGGSNSNNFNRNGLVCSNSNCNRRGHTIENCYWPGGGKAGQFPPGFGKRRAGRGSANNVNANANANAQQTSANTVNENTEQVFALVTHISPNAPL